MSQVAVPTETEECPVCLENIQNINNIGIVNNCGHRFCLKCLIQWCVHSEILHCPMCRCEYISFTVNNSNILVIYLKQNSTK